MPSFEELQAIKKEITRHDSLYFGLDTPEITDEEYDALKKRANDLELIVPGEVSQLFPSYRHAFAIKSLAKIKKDDLRKELIRLCPGIIQPKEDGMTIVIYPDGAIVTRGDGETGENITHTANNISGIKPYRNPVRAEAVMEKTTFNELNDARATTDLDTFKNPRNTIAGMLRSKDGNKVKGITYKAYNIVGSTLSEIEQLAELRAAGFDVVDVFEYTENTIEQAIDYVLSFNRINFPREIDGLVIKSNKPNALAVFGETGHHPKSMVAYKFPSQGVWTKLKEVIWQVGRTGKITPVAVIEPTELLGTTVTRSTLHNFGFMDALGVTVGCEVFLIKANDIIPAITEVRIGGGPRTRFIEPLNCPICAGATTKTNDRLFCNNPDCGAKLLRDICHIAKRDALDIEGMSEETAKKIINANMAIGPFDIFDLTVASILTLPGFAEKSAENLFNSIQAAKNPELNRFIYAAGIPNIGRTASRAIANEFKTLPAFWADIAKNLPQTAQIPGIGAMLIESIKQNSALLKALEQKITPKEVDTMQPSPANGKVLTFVITGTLSQPREYFERLITQTGHKISGSVTKTTDYLLAGDKAGSKRAKAESLGIKIITETQLNGSLSLTPKN